jgi:cell division septation protein DedD
LATAYVLIDFENVQPKALGAFGGGAYKVMVFVGQGQKSVSVDLASALQELGDAGSYIQIEGRGPNALDMHIAYYIGRIAATDPGAVFHVISRDRDYDPLIRHLKTRHIECTRWKSVAEINAARLPAPATPRTHTPKSAHKPSAKAAPAKAAAKAAPKATPKPAPKAAAKAASERVDEVIRNLEKRERARPSTAKALASTIKALYRGGITDDEVASVVAELTLRGVVTIDGEKVRYQLP